MVRPGPFIPSARVAAHDSDPVSVPPGDGQRIGHSFHVVALADSGHIAPILFWFFDDRVEVWHRDETWWRPQHVGTLHRRTLIHWLADPNPYIRLCDETVVLEFIPATGVLLSVPGVTRWHINPAKAAALCKSLAM